MKQTLLLLASLAMMIVLSGCDSATDDMSKSVLRQWVGKNVRVQFQRDALGAAASLPVSPTTGEINGAQTCVVEKLVSVEATAIVIGPEDRPKWIPLEVILLVEANP